MPHSIVIEDMEVILLQGATEVHGSQKNSVSEVKLCSGDRSSTAGMVLTGKT